MNVVQIQFAPWDKIYYFDPAGLDLKAGDKVVVKTELGLEIGEVKSFKVLSSVSEIDSADRPEKEEENGGDEEEAEGKEQFSLKPILRLANYSDLEKLTPEDERKKALIYCRKIVEKHQLPMKLIDIHFSLEGSRVTVAFIADGRVDFRELVKDLTRYFNRTVRLQQIGIRDEARLSGDYGHCGRPLCCRGFLNNLDSITSEMAEAQQCVHRGSERLSGVCGRLMCCLSYEAEGYKAMLAKMPPLGAKVNVDGKKGIVVGHNILKQSVDVEFSGENGEGRTVVEVDLNRKKSNR